MDILIKTISKDRKITNWVKYAINKRANFFGIEYNLTVEIFPYR